METTTPILAASTWGKAILLWLLTNAIGSVACFALMTAESAFKLSNDQSFMAVLIIIFAGLGSVIVIPIAFFAFRSLLAMPDRNQRLLAGAAAVTGLFALPCFSLFLLMGTAPVLALHMGGWLYLPAALLAAAAVYFRALFRPDNASGLSITHD